jgi:hypothetical protein
MVPDRPLYLELRVEEIESRTRPGCDSSSTNPLCTCRPPAAQSQ